MGNFLVLVLWKEKITFEGADILQMVLFTWFNMSYPGFQENLEIK